MNPEEIEKASAEVYAKTGAPRVTLQDIENAIGSITYVTADRLLHIETEWKRDVSISKTEDHARIYTICMVTLRNGWTIIGGSAPASSENFDPMHGRKLAYDQCIKQIWPLMGFALKQATYDGEGFDGR